MSAVPKPENHVSRVVQIHNPPLEEQRECEKHGAFLSKCHVSKSWSKCPTCAKDDYESEQKKAADAEQAQRVAAWESRLKRAAIPKRFISRTLESFVPDESMPAMVKAKRIAVEYAQAFKDNNGRCLAFVGTPGTGKTHLACGIALHIMREYKCTTLFTTVFSAIGRIKSSWDKSSVETEAQAIDALVFPDLLILDEVGQQHGSETEKMLFFAVLNERHQQCKPTVLLSNLPLDDYEKNGVMQPGLRSYLGERVLDRMREDGGVIVPMNWESYRGRA